MNATEPDKPRMSRRDFLKWLGFGASLIPLTGGIAALAARSHKEPLVWQIDPFKCNQCGLCATQCVLDQSAAKCVNDFSMCGYCTLCFGFFQTNPNSLDEGAENQMCPTGALKRTFVEDPYHEYTIDEKLCIGCGKCVKGCARFGNGSLYLQLRHDRCLNCNECSIAIACPTEAFVRLPASRPYVIKHEGLPKA